jgi:hypothetical protein
MTLPRRLLLWRRPNAVTLTQWADSTHQGCAIQRESRRYVVPAPDHVFAPAGFLFIVLVCLVPAHALGLEHAVKSEVVVDGTNLDRFGTVDVQSTSLTSILRACTPSFAPCRVASTAPKPSTRPSRP